MIDSYEHDEEDPNFSAYGLKEAAEKIVEPELSKMIVELCDEMPDKCVRYIGKVLEFQHGHPGAEADYSRRFAHNAIITNLKTITRTLGGEHWQWFNDELMHGGLGGEENRERIGKWAINQALDILQAQAFHEQQEQGDDTHDNRYAA